MGVASYFLLKDQDFSGIKTTVTTGLEKLPFADVLPEKQGGSFNRSYDGYFYDASQVHGVPFALLKAIAIRESSLNPSAYRLEPSGFASFGLLQVLWKQGSQRFERENSRMASGSWGYPDDFIRDGSILYEPQINADIACRIIRYEYNRYPTLRDVINAYNTGKSESKIVAPHNYVEDILGYYAKILNTPRSALT